MRNKNIQTVWCLLIEGVSVSSALISDNTLFKLRAVILLVFFL